MATLAEAGRITERDVDEEIVRLRAQWHDEEVADEENKTFGRDQSQESGRKRG